MTVHNASLRWGWVEKVRPRCKATRIPLSMSGFRTAAGDPGGRASDAVGTNGYFAGSISPMTSDQQLDRLHALLEVGPLLVRQRPTR